MSKAYFTWLGICSNLMPKEVFKMAVTKDSQYIVMCRFGAPEFADDEIELVQRIKKAGSILEIKLLDYFVLTKKIIRTLTPYKSEIITFLS
jgi:DNA repair protein RadC